MVEDGSNGSPAHYQLRHFLHEGYGTWKLMHVAMMVVIALARLRICATYGGFASHYDLDPLRPVWNDEIVASSSAIFAPVS
jgi:hypothetical protein